MAKSAVALLAILMSLVTLAGPASAAADNGGCATPIYVFTYTGAAVNNSSSLYTPTVATGAVGCQTAPAGTTTDTRWIVPGSTFANSRLVAPVGAAPTGTVTGLGASWAGRLLLREVVPGEFFYESPIVPISPTAMGTLEATVNGFGPTTYRTIGAN